MEYEKCESSKLLVFSDSGVSSPMI